MRIDKTYNLFSMKERMAELSKEISNDRQWLVQKSKEGYVVPTDEMKERMAHRDNLSYELEAQQLGQVKAQFARGGGASDESIKAKAAFYRGALAGGVVKSYEGLGAIPAGDVDLGNGDAFLPTNLSDQLLMEPLVQNPFREVCRVTNVPGLEEAKLGFTIDDNAIADVTDKETAHEIELSGDTVTYGRHKLKITATVKDTVMHGTDTNLVSSVENALRSALAINELTRMFAPAETADSDAEHKHMSFYATENAVKTVEAADLIDAIGAALADLPLTFRRNAAIGMNPADWYAIWKTALNQSGTMFGAVPENLFGRRVVLADEVTAGTAVVGDFSYYGINYDRGSLYDTDKDIKRGEYFFALTAWSDQQIRLKSAFRIAKKTV